LIPSHFNGTATPSESIILRKQIIMKKIIFALVSSAAALTGVAHAQTSPLQGVYVGAGAVAQNYKYDVEGAASGDHNNGTKAGGKLFVGYNIDKNWAVEGGYTDFGSKSYSYTQAGLPGQIDTGSHAFYVAGKGTLPVTQDVSVYGKLGAARTHDGVNGTGVASNLSSSDPSETTVYAAVGAAYAINEKVSLTAEYEHYGKTPDYGRKKGGVSVNAIYNF
jgi:OOP family OmpA-OmpF porin